MCEDWNNERIAKTYEQLPRGERHKNVVIPIFLFYGRPIIEQGKSVPSVTLLASICEVRPSISVGTHNIQKFFVIFLRPFRRV
jgi:hypothetical protein